MRQTAGVNPVRLHLPALAGGDLRRRYDVASHSLAAQQRLFYEFCKSRDWEPVALYREEGRSAHSESIKQRPAFRQVLEDASKRKFDNVVVHTLDRWSRNLRVTLESLKTLAENDVGLVSITENIDYSTAQGKLFTQMLGSFAEYFSESLSTHVKKGQSERATADQIGQAHDQEYRQHSAQHQRQTLKEVFLHRCAQPQRGQRPFEDQYREPHRYG